jgi:ATP-dependent Clp protease ATP-binding subunit ClpB
MTTNIGSHLIQENFEKINTDNALDVIDETRGQVYEMLKKSVRPEFLNRIDETIMFMPLDRTHIRKIVEIQFGLIRKQLNENGIAIEASEEVLDYLGELGFDPQFGARPLKRVIQRKVLNELSKEVLSGNIERDSVVSVEMNKAREIEFLNIDQVPLKEEFEN